MSRVPGSDSLDVHGGLEDLLDGVGVGLHSLVVLHLVQEDVIRLEPRVSVPRGHVYGSLLLNKLRGEVSQTTESDLAELATPTAAAHHLYHPVHAGCHDWRYVLQPRRVERLRDLFRCSPIHHVLEDVARDVVQLARDHVVYAEPFLLFRSVVELPHSCATDGDLELPMTVGQVQEEFLEACLRVGRQHTAIGETHAHRSQAQGIHGVNADKFRLRSDELVYVERVGHHYFLPLESLEEGRLQFPQAVGGRNRLSLSVWRVGRQGPEGHTGFPDIGRDATEEGGQR